MTTEFDLLEEDILAELRERDLEVHRLRSALEDRGHEVSQAEVYEKLVHLEAMRRVRVVVQGRKSRARLWGAGNDAELATRTERAVDRILTDLQPAADRFDRPSQRNVHFAA